MILATDAGGGATLRRTVQIEFNELSPLLIDKFIDAGELPNFKRLRDVSRTFVTDASEELSLNPWVQWPTLHTGIRDCDHGIRQLGEAHRVGGRGVARELADAGFTVGVFGSMNMDYGPLRGFVLPDAWNSEAVPHPAELRAFTDFVGAAVQENSANALNKKALVPFLRFLLSNGLKIQTAMAVLRHLIDERRDPGLKWRRAMLLDRMAYDVFCSLVNRHQVSYATFFSNSVAHLQHYYWRNFEPDKFSFPPPDGEHPSLHDAIIEGYRSNDRLIGRFLKDFPDSTLVFVTALSQQPWDTTKCLYRPKDFSQLLQLLGIDMTSIGIEPVMADTFCLRSADSAATDRVIEQIGRARIGDQPLFLVERNEQVRVVVKCSVNDMSAAGLMITLPNGGEVKFADHFHRIHGVRSGRHHPEGCFWIQSKAPCRIEERVPVTAVAPTILRLFDVPAPAYMKQPPLPLS